MIGRKLDKYEILEEVGQGGMAVVYKGLDTSLHREVAVKVLHPHLANHEEARKRFEREARAVAKLRHENILEIFDYSGKESQDSYIVTEFIRGRTLKDFITKHPPAYPEIGVMITAEVCRALAHAHAGGVLHRDVKPENIMIREDGVVKLTDFGIAQILDAQKMTMTGQLLGSPAYMAPEHVEGKPLDFRTDVFAIGILLYQLTTGELPFKGRNPHEILKRIADCKFLDARVVNPLVGERLNKIINKALAKEPDLRYQDVQPLLDDLMKYLGEAELTDPRAELKPFFLDPAATERRIKLRLIDALTRRGRAELAAKKTAVALELFNRVLTIDPANAEVLGEMDRLSRKRRLGRTAAVALALAAAAGATALIATRVKAGGDERPAPPAPVAVIGVDAGGTVVQAPPVDAGVVAAVIADAAPRVVISPTIVDVRPPRQVVRAARPDGGAASSKPAETAGVMRTFRVTATPKSARVSLDGGAAQMVGAGLDLDVPPGAHELRFSHSTCREEVVRISAGDKGREINVQLAYKPGRVVARCEAATSIHIDGKPASSGNPFDIVSGFDSAWGSKMVTVEFVLPSGLQTKRVKVVAGTVTNEVTCDST